MYRKLLKKIAVCVMMAAVCVGAFVPMHVKAADQADVIGTWKNGPGGTTTFHEDGMATDNWNTRAYHMESGTVTVKRYSDGSEETISYDLWRGETAPGSLEDNDGKRDACVFRLDGDGVMTGWNIVREGDTVYARNACSMKKVVNSSSSEDKDEEGEETAEQEAERKALEEARKESVRLEREAAEQGFQNGAQMQAAHAQNKSSGEYYNNAVVTTEGIENAVPVAQGGKLIIDGQMTNASATVSKVSSVYVESVRAAREGTVLNVVDVQFPVTSAIVNFYMPGIAAGDNITAAQFIDGAWTDVEVVEVRDDHILLYLKGNGVVAFLKK